MNIDLSIIGTTFGQYVPILPELILIVAALLMPAFYFATKNGKVCAGLSLAAVALSGGLVALMMAYGKLYGEYGQLFSFDPFSGLMMLIFASVGFLVILISPASSEMTKHQGEYYALMLGALAGMMFVASADNLLTIYLGVELVSISSYALVALKKNDPRSSEAAVKYLIIGSLSSALTLYGISMLYGLTGSIEITQISAALATAQFSWPLAVAVIALVAGYGFKISAVPFHAWAPDVYEGASTPVSTFLAVGSKKMGFAVFFKVFLVIFVIQQTNVFFASEPIQYLFAIIAAITMTYGNIVAISQDNIKRMLAYSSIAQAGYIMIALAVASEYALTGGLYHMMTHVFMKGGAFIVVAALISVGIGEKISDYNGLAKRAPIVAAAMLIFLFSLAGIPPLAGFTSKFVLFSSAIVVDGAVSYQWIWLAVIAILNSAISLYYYARVVKAMYIAKGDSEEKLAVKKSHLVAILLCVAAVIVLGVFPDWPLQICADASAYLFAL